jgi:hypothetical protein
VNKALGGWQIAAVTTLKSGLPFTPAITGDRANTGAGGQRPNVIGTPFVPKNLSCWYYTSANSTCKALFPNATDAFAVQAQYTIGTGGRNILRADNLALLDFSVLKDVPVTESRRLQFRAEFFNIVNHPVFNAPGAAIDQGSGGQVSRRSTATGLLSGLLSSPGSLFSEEQTSRFRSVDARSTAPLSLPVCW